MRCGISGSFDDSRAGGLLVHVLDVLSPVFICSLETIVKKLNLIS